jgi:hypothetical protein
MKTKDFFLKHSLLLSLWLILFPLDQYIFSVTEAKLENISMQEFIVSSWLNFFIV